MRENRLSGGVGGVAGNSRHPDPIRKRAGIRIGSGIMHPLTLPGDNGTW